MASIQKADGEFEKNTDHILFQHTLLFTKMFHNFELCSVSSIFETAKFKGNSGLRFLFFQFDFQIQQENTRTLTWLLMAVRFGK